jgi:hypothetical protein
VWGGELSPRPVIEIKTPQASSSSSSSSSSSPNPYTIPFLITPAPRDGAKGASSHGARNHSSNTRTTHTQRQQTQGKIGEESRMDATGAPKTQTKEMRGGIKGDQPTTSTIATTDITTDAGDSRRRFWSKRRETERREAERKEAERRETEVMVARAEAFLLSPYNIKRSTMWETVYIT